MDLMHSISKLTNMINLLHGQKNLLNFAFTFQCVTAWGNKNNKIKHIKVKQYTFL